MSVARSIRRVRAVLALAAGLAFCAGTPAANSFSNDVTDLWWNPDESGWGLNLIQQSNVVFATMFVYDMTGTAHWYVASDMTASSVPSDIPYNWRGALYETTGPAFSAGAFDPATVARRQVGTMSFEFMPPGTGTLTYSIDGANVTKKLQRQTWAANSVAGAYAGGIVTRIFAPFNPTCSVPTGLQLFDDIEISQSGTSVTMTAVRGAAPPDELCRYTGTYSQAGHMGNVSGAFSCDGGANGTFTLSEIEAGVHGISARYSAIDRNCDVYGNFSAVRAN